MRLSHLFLPSLILVASAHAVTAADGPEFTRNIRPVLADACFHCHGPDPESRKADLRLDTEDGLFSGADAPIDRENPEQSPLLRRIVSTDPDEVMPPPENHRQLEPEEVDLLKQWVLEGAPWEAHWAFEAPQKPAFPQSMNQDWARNGIDHFVLATLEANGLNPAKEADPRTLVRRLALDLTGLPPDPAVVERFAADPSEDAYQKLIESMLGTVQYAEHRARYWLDAARYADTHGMHFDNYREMWPYRDWVVQAFHRNQPFDTFTLDQIAGDLLENPTRDQLVATGFQRCNITTNEGGTIQEENLANYAADRVQTVGWVYMGLTTNCAQCHDHKFDPITAKDYYAMAAFFRNTTQGAMDGNVKDGRGPAITVPMKADAARWDALPDLITSAKNAVTARRENARADFDQWLENFSVEQLDEQLPRDAVALPVSTEPVVIHGDNTPNLGEAGNFKAEAPFTVSLWVKPGNVRQNASILARMDVAQKHRGWDVWQEGKRVGVHLIHAWPEAGIKAISQAEVLKKDSWTHLTLRWEGGNDVKGWTLLVDGVSKPLRSHKNTLKTEQSVQTLTPLTLGRRSKGAAYQGVVKGLRLYTRSLTKEEAALLAQEETFRTLLDQPADQRDAKALQPLFDFYLQAHDHTFGQLQGELASLESEREAIRQRSPITHVQVEKETPAMANILMRGQYDKVGEEVAADTPAAFPPMPEGAPRNRLGLAQWLISPDNPLTARVTVNRFWQEIFGQGLVVSVEDFGIMGAPPSHPELLDWLAVTFQETDWNVKEFFRLMVSSSTYRQAAKATPEKLEKDPHNALLSRGPRFRMDAEMVRDYALAASGTLSLNVGGPSTRPYQPEGVWDVVGLPGGDTRNYVQDQGEGLYRRTLYNFWKRMAPPPNLEAFNAPSREMCTVRRERTNTPLQALVTMNDPQFVEAARRLAEKVLCQSSQDDAMLDHLGERILMRTWSDEERHILHASLNDLRAHYEAHPADAKALLEVGDSPSDESLPASQLAAWTMLANQLFNLDETLNK